MPFELPAPTTILDVALDDGAAIRVRRHGKPDGVRLLLSHGNGFATDAIPKGQILLSSGWQGDLDERPGVKFATADLIGVPWQILVGPRSLAEGKVEVKKRSDGSRELMSLADAVVRLTS